MAEIKAGNKTYVYYKYRDGSRVKSVYCGPKGSPATEKKLQAIKNDFLLKKIQKLQKQMKE